MLSTLTEVRFRKGFLPSPSTRPATFASPEGVVVLPVGRGSVVAVSVGRFFGIWPSLKAARLDPIVALRV
jgi:hypothetical protein